MIFIKEITKILQLFLVMHAAIAASMDDNFLFIFRYGWGIEFLSKRFFLL